MCRKLLGGGAWVPGPVGACPRSAATEGSAGLGRREVPGGPVHSGAALPRDVILTAPTPAQLSALTPIERRLVALVETNVVLVHMPKGGTLAQRGVEACGDLHGLREEHIDGPRWYLFC